jgi:hypothetical protein
MKFYNGEDSNRYRDQADEDLQDPYVSHDSGRKAGIKGTIEEAIRSS